METKTFEKPTLVTKLDMAFGGIALDLMPKMKDIPKEFKQHDNPFVEWQQKWFFEGLKKNDILKIKPKAGINVGEALAHLRVIQGSFEPQHEHKEAGAAYLASLWFESI